MFTRSHQHEHHIQTSHINTPRDSKQHGLNSGDGISILSQLESVFEMTKKNDFKMYLNNSSSLGLDFKPQLMTAADLRNRGGSLCV